MKGRLKLTGYDRGKGRLKPGKSKQGKQRDKGTGMLRRHGGCQDTDCRKEHTESLGTSWKSLGTLGDNADSH